MNITVFGANGRVGTLVVQKLVERGHHVNAFVHGAHSFGDNPQLTLTAGDINDKSAVSAAVTGADIIVSTLSSWGSVSKDILTVGMKNIIPAAETQGVSAIISLTGAAAIAPGEKFDSLGRLNRQLLKLVGKKILEDGEMHIQLLSRSKLRWTVIRSPVMTKSGTQNHYTLSTSQPKPWQTILREDVANAIVRLTETHQWENKAPFIQRN